jgi:hypothetical protein
MNTFKQYLLDTYTSDELKDIAEYGCESGLAHTMIYYTDTNALYELHCDELHETLGNLIDDIGFVPQFITNHIGDSVCFKNAMVWTIAEYYANDILVELEETI